MMRPILPAGLAVFALSAGLLACGDADEPESLDDPDETVTGFSALGDGDDDLDAVEITLIGDEVVGGLSRPSDLEFNPNADDQLWVINYDDNSTTIFFDPGTDDQDDEKYNTFGSDHFLVNPAAMAFNADEEMATAQQTDEETQPETPTDFMGPTLWPTDLGLFDAGQPSHLDMLHNSPLSSGIAWDESDGIAADDVDRTNDQRIAFWVFDGYHGALTHYDFVSDHGPGGHDHSDGVVHRFADGEVAIEDDVVAHLAYDSNTKLLYAADTGNNRIAVLDTTSGQQGDDIFPNYDNSTQTYVDGADLWTLVDGESEGFEKPAGLELHADHLFVADNATSTVYAYNLDGELVDWLDVSDEIEPGGLMGMTFDAEDRLYLTDAQDDKIIRVEGK